MQIYNIACSNPEFKVQTEEGEVIFINDVAIGVSIHYDYGGDDDDDTPEKPLYNVTHLETGSLIVKDSEDKEKAIGVATKRINASYWQKSITAMIEQLKKNDIEYPVNDVSKFKIQENAKV